MLKKQCELLDITVDKILVLVPGTQFPRPEYLLE